MSTIKVKPVLIIGAGPTGMTAAMELSRFGIPVRLFDKKAAPDESSRAIGVQARTLELFAQRGLVEEMLKIGNKSSGASIYGGGKRVFRLDYSQNESSYGYMLFISQAETERILREELARRRVAIERPVEMIALAQENSSAGHASDGGVSATFRHADGSLEEVEGSYLISAEGAHSTVRSTLGLDFQGKAFQEDYALGDLHVEGDLPASDLHVFSSEHGFMGMFPMSQSHFRIIASNPLSKPSKDTAPALEELQRMYDMRSHIPARLFDLTWSSWFRINSRMVDHLQKKRFFLGGDSAHIHSPAGGQGMNTGIQDIINLSWKLAYVLEGKASPSLLDTYGEDRIPVIRNVLKKTEQLTEVIGTGNPIFRAIFEHMAPLVVGTEFIQEKSTAQMSQISLNYRDSSLSETHDSQGDLRAGDRVPDLIIKVISTDTASRHAPQEAHLFGLLNPSSFTLLNLNGKDSTAWDAEIKTNLTPWLGMINVHRLASAEHDLVSKAQYEKHFGTAPAIVLVRPDSYIGFMGSLNSISSLIAYMEKRFPVKTRSMQPIPTSCGPC